MRICLFTPTFLPQVGGVELAVHYTAKALAEQGHEVTILTFRWKGREVAPDGYRVASMVPGLARLKGRLSPVKEYAVALALARLHRRWRYDVLHVHMAYPGGPAAMLLRRWLKVPTVITCHAADVQTYPELGYGFRLDRRLERRMRLGLEKADAVTAVSQSVARDVHALCPAIGDVHIVPNGVASDRFGHAPLDMRRALGIGTAEKVILAVGRNHPKKGYSLLLKALAILKRSHDSFRCVIVGKDTDSLQADISALNLESTVHLVGQVPKDGILAPGPSSVPPPELVSLYLQSDVLVSPSYIEGFSLVLPEAMMAGLPVVATRAPGNVDIVENDENGLLVNTGDAQGMASALYRILSDESLRKRLSHSARRTGMRYDWRRITAMYLDVYHKVAAR